MTPLPSWDTVGAAERLLLAATHPQPAFLDVRPSLDVDHAVVMTSAHRNKVVPRTWAYLASRLDSPARAAWQPLKDLAVQMQRAAARRHLHTLELVRTFEAQGIETLPMKGTLLSERLYGDATVRQSNDVDLLVRPASFPRALEILQNRGYRVIRPAVMPEAAGMKWLLEDYGDYNVRLASGAGDLHIELHWRLTGDGRFPAGDMSQFWRSLVTHPTAGTEVRALEDADLLLYLAVHGVKDHWRCLSWLADFAWLVRRSPTSVANARERARDTGLSTMWEAACILLERWYGVPANAQRNERARYLADHASLLKPDPLVIPGGGRRYQWMTHDSWMASVRGSARFYLTPGTWSVESSGEYSPTRQRWRRAARFLGRTVRSAELLCRPSS